MNCPRARRPTPPSRRPAAGRALFCAALIAAVAPAPGAADESSLRDARTEIAGYADLARKAASEKKWPLADHFLGLLATVDAPDKEKKAAFRELAEEYEKEHIPSRAIAIYEKMIELYAADADTPDLIFRVGILYRESGVPKMAIARFYTVLNSALKFGGEDLASYQSLAQKAQWEIAETYFQSGDFEKAQKYYELLARLDLPPVEQARVRFKITHCLFITDNVPGAITSAQSFLEQFANDPAAAECRYLLASAYRTQHRSREAFDTVLSLLRAETVRRDKEPEKWTYWKKKAGNEFANFYYQQGDSLSALTIYQAIARLSDDPEWQWPALYQMGLCFEHLRYGDRAADTYKYLLDEGKKPGREGDKLPEILRTILEMAKWRADQLAWSHSTAVSLKQLLANPLTPAAPETTKL